MQDLSNFMSEQRASSSPQSINTVNVKSGSGFSSNGATRGGKHMHCKGTTFTAGGLSVMILA